MNRRTFLAAAGAFSSSAALRSQTLIPPAAAPDPAVEKVLAIFKTHLDVGFTDLAERVMATYFERFIPGVLSLTERIAREGRQDRYVWTTGSWLIYRYLEEAPAEERRRMERAIEAGVLVWHGLPFSVESELLDRPAFRLATAYAARLDARFHRKTLAAKMTDVAGHSRGIVPVMAEAGLELLHVGVNDACPLPDTAPLFRWKSPDNTELTMLFQSGYGDVMVLPGGRTAVSVNFTGDNRGPHTLEQIDRIYARLRERFPKARVFASDLNQLAMEIRPLRASLPVVTQEIGDTWVHGAASDPLLMARYRELSRLRQEWVAEGKLEANGEADLEFGKQFLRVPEHTWGMNIESLHDYTSYDTAAFRAARSRPEFKRMEASWAEKRSCIDMAVATLPAGMAAQARERLAALRPARAKLTGAADAARPESPYDTRHFRIAFDGRTGAVCGLEDRATGRQWAHADHPLGLFAYETFSQPDFDRWMRQYVREKYRKVDWTVRGWTKPGLEKSSAKSGLSFARLKRLRHQRSAEGDRFVAELEMPDEENSGSPREVEIETLLPASERAVRMTMKWFRKPAVRLPEALWFSFTPDVTPEGRWEMDKMGQAVSPLDVVANGARTQHGVIRGVSYRDGRGGVDIETADAFLAMPGRRALLTFDNRQPDMAGGMHFCLYNNLTGTNYTMWYEDDAQFRFALRFG